MVIVQPPVETRFPYGAIFRKATRSRQTGDCVEVASNLADVVAVRDSKDPGGAVLVFTPAEWGAIIGGVKDGHFDL